MKSIYKYELEIPNELPRDRELELPILHLR